MSLGMVSAHLFDLAVVLSSFQPGTEAVRDEVRTHAPRTSLKDFAPCQSVVCRKHARPRASMTPVERHVRETSPHARMCALSCPVPSCVDLTAHTFRLSALILATRCDFVLRDMMCVWTCVCECVSESVRRPRRHLICSAYASCLC